MKGIFVNENGGIRYAKMIVNGYKPIETRPRNMLRDLVGERVAVVRTRRGKNPMVLGYVTIYRADFCPAEFFDAYRDLTLIPKGSAYDCNGRGKWFYFLSNANPCDPFPLPGNAVRHGRSWCEF